MRQCPAKITNMSTKFQFPLEEEPYLDENASRPASSVVAAANSVIAAGKAASASEPKDSSKYTNVSIVSMTAVFELESADAGAGGAPTLDFWPMISPYIPIQTRNATNTAWVTHNSNTLVEHKCTSQKLSQVLV
jgi:hypothetical protein